MKRASVPHNRPTDGFVVITRALSTLLVFDSAIGVSHAADNSRESWWHKLWTDPVATYTGALFIATAALIITSWLQWRETRNVAKKQLRAYLGATPQDVRFIGNNHLQTYVEIANTGSTPARNVRQWTQIEIRGPTDNKSFLMPNPGYGKRTVVPGAKWLLGLELIVTDDQLRELNTGKKVLFVWGRAEYTDIFGTNHWLNSRYRNIGVVFAMNAQGERTSLGWALFAEEEGNDAS
jgi:hypothetical protein